MTQKQKKYLIGQVKRHAKDGWSEIYMKKDAIGLMYLNNNAIQTKTS